MGGYFLEYNNFIPAIPYVTPLHIAPVWYFTPFYSMLRAVTTELMYVLMALTVGGAALAVLKIKMPSLFKGAIVGGAVVIATLMFLLEPKFWGVVAMGAGVVILFFLPWLDNSEAKSIRYRPSWHKYLYAVFVVDFMMLGYLGIQPPSELFNRLSQIGTLFYFGFFLLMPWWSRMGVFKPVPSRVVFKPH
jgi:ubiquinol-cytochrome c reductase cytochrome b subunit